MPAPVLLLLLGALCLPPARASSHSHLVFSSALSGGLPGVPQYSVAGFVDDVLIEAYSSETPRFEPRAPWMGRVAESDPRYWERNTETQRGNEAADRANVKTLMGRHNQTAVPPQAMISRKESHSATTLTCYAYGFYPRDIEMKWVRNGVEVDWKTKTILPNTDGTYQIRSTVELPEGDNEKDYRCQVDHISLEEIIIKVYKEESGTENILIIVGVIVGVLGVLGAFAAAFIWKRKHRGKSNSVATNQGQNDYVAVNSTGIAGPDSTSSNSSV